MTKRRYFIYWEDTKDGLSGNIIFELDFNKICLKKVIEHIIEVVNNELKKDYPKINSLVIKFMMELK